MEGRRRQGGKKIDKYKFKEKQQRLFSETSSKVRLPCGESLKSKLELWKHLALTAVKQKPRPAQSVLLTHFPPAQSCC